MDEEERLKKYTDALEAMGKAAPVANPNPVKNVYDANILELLNYTFPEWRMTLINYLLKEYDQNIEHLQSSLRQIFEECRIKSPYPLYQFFFLLRGGLIAEILSQTCQLIEDLGCIIHGLSNRTNFAKKIIMNRLKSYEISDKLKNFQKSDEVILYFYCYPREPRSGEKSIKPFKTPEAAKVVKTSLESIKKMLTDVVTYYDRVVDIYLKYKHGNIFIPTTGSVNNITEEMVEEAKGLREQLVTIFDTRDLSTPEVLEEIEKYTLMIPLNEPVIQKKWKRLLKTGNFLRFRTQYLKGHNVDEIYNIAVKTFKLLYVLRGNQIAKIRNKNEYVAAIFHENETIHPTTIKI